MYKLTCELFEASSERFTTGIPGIDRLNKSSQDMYGWSYTDVNGVPYADRSRERLADRFLRRDDAMTLWPIIRN